MWQLWLLQPSNKDSCTKRLCLRRVSTNLLDKSSHLTAFCAWDSSPCPPSAADEAWYWLKCVLWPYITSRPIFFREMWFVDCSYTQSIEDVVVWTVCKTLVINKCHSHMLNLISLFSVLQVIGSWGRGWEQGYQKPIASRCGKKCS